MFKNRSFQVKMVKDADKTPVAPEIDPEEVCSNLYVLSKGMSQEAMKVIAVTMILDTGRRILVSRLSK